MKYEAVTKSQMANSIGVSLRTFQRRLVSVGLKIPRGLINTDNQAKILIKLGYSIKTKHKESN